MTNNYPKISVIMSAYNSEKLLSRAIESILNQTFEDLEILIADDGSSDKPMKYVLILVNLAK